MKTYHMAVLFSSDAEQVIHRAVEADDSNEDGDQWQEFFEVERCCQWITDGQFKRVANIPMIICMYVCVCI